MIIQYRDVKQFDSLVFRGPGTLDIVQSEREGLCIEADARYLGQIQSRVIDGCLQLGLSHRDIIPLAAYSDSISYRLQVRDLSRLEVVGSGIVTMSDIDRDEFDIRLRGRADVSLEQLTADRLHVSASDKARLVVSGDVEHQCVCLKGQASYRADTVVSDTASVRLLDDSEAMIKVNDELDSYLGAGTRLTYIGYPDVQKQGQGSLIRQRKQFIQPLHSQKGS